MGKKKENNIAGGIVAIIADYLAYDYFEGLGIIGVILWLICLPFILIWKIIVGIFNIIF